MRVRIMQGILLQSRDVAAHRGQHASISKVYFSHAPFLMVHAR